MWTALRHHAFARLFAAALVSEIGNKIHRIALLVLVYGLTRQAGLVSLVLGVQLVATIGVGPLIAPWADVQERRRLLFACDLLRAPIVVLIPLIGVHSLPVLMVLVFGLEVLRSLHAPVVQAVVPDLLPEDALDHGNGLMQFTQRIGEVAFVGLAGILVTTLGIGAAFYIDAASFVLSACLIAQLPRLQAAPSQRAGYWLRARAGMGYLWREPSIRNIVVPLFSAALFGSMDQVLGIVLAIRVLGAGSAGFGVMEAGMALGAVVGTMSVAWFTTRFRREHILLCGLIGFGLCEASFGAFPVLAWVVGAHVLAGIANMLFMVPARTQLQVKTPPELRTRVFAAFGAVMNGAVLIGMMLAAGLERSFTASGAFVIAGSSVVVVSVLSFGVTLIQQRRLPVPVRGWRNEAN
ncbi:MAG: MFS transporter [Herpetosiphon sp.]